ncbi:MAG: [protein-PII] uridylyltransferase [Brevundimonas sp.]|uniref:[protein-PII] uridylyltransferase n=1 Tax=Brevundimonas sp. TaxID=1871086 RepID=UPI00391DEE57
MSPRASRQRHDEALERLIREASAAGLDAPQLRERLKEPLRQWWLERLRRAEARLIAGTGGLEVARSLARRADALLVHLWTLATEQLYPAPNALDSERLSLLATGGYGRGVLAPHSDLDLLFLRPWKANARAEAVTEFILYVLWDMGLKVGWAARSLDDNLRVARSDMTVRTTLLEARPVAGDESLSAAFLERFYRFIDRSDPRPFIAAKLEERDRRHMKAGRSRYRVEPNVKDGKGGLRDLNSLFWIARHLAPDSPLGARVMGDLLTAREERRFEEAFDFLWSVRAHLHFLAGRAEERLSFDLQPEIARRMGWSGRGEEPAVERFMRRYFLNAREVGALTRALCAKLEERGQKTAHGLSRLLPRRVRKLDEPGLIIAGGRLSVEGPHVFTERPAMLMGLFAAADRLDLDLHPDAFAAVMRSMARVGPSLRRDAGAAGAFLDVLARGREPYRVLSLMNETGLLGRFMPEFARVVGQTQFNMYHAYTVDEHTLRAIGIVSDIARGRLRDDHPLASEIVPRIIDREALMLAMLLHDVGKGGARGQLEDGAIAARRACERLGLSAARCELVAWLVRHHLLLSDTAQKRDVSDPDTVRWFARQVGEPERLRMLLVMTVADIRAVGPGIWNGWKGQLMRDLYKATLRVFRGESLEPVRVDEDFAPLIARAGRSGAAALLRERTDLNTTELLVCAPDRKGLFADITAALARLHANVISARIVTHDDMALDLFELQDRGGAPFARSDEALRSRLVSLVERAARGEVSPSAREAPPDARTAAFEVIASVSFDNSVSAEATVIETSGVDRPGLLARLAATLSDHGLSIRSAHAASFGERAVDAFYVTRDDAPLDDKRLDALLKADLLEALGIERAPPRRADRALPRARASRSE